MRYLIILISAVLLSGCSTLKFWEDEEPAPEAKAEKDEHKPIPEMSSSLTEEQELKMAKLWARVDELEEETFRQKERIRVLEKGITLGLVPEELKKGGKEKKAKDDQAEVIEPLHAAIEEAKSDAHGKHDKKEKKEAKAEKPAAPALSKEEQDKFQSMLAAAQEQYRAGRYGRAIVEYDALGKAFGDNVEGGMHLFWIAKSWSNLKENNTSRQLFADFLKDHPTSPWAARAQLELGRVEWKLGLQETALKRFRDLIQQHPHEDASEMARMEIETLDKSL